MTKKEIIELIKAETEREYKVLKAVINKAGEDSELAKTYRTSWATLYELSKKLGIN